MLTELTAALHIAIHAYTRRPPTTTRHATQQASKHRIETGFLGGGARHLAVIDGADRSRRQRIALRTRVGARAYAWN